MSVECKKWSSPRSTFFWQCCLPFIITVLATNAAHAQISFLSKWGTFGSGDGQFNAPGLLLNLTSGPAVAAQPDGHVYVADTLNNRIQRFDRFGTHVETYNGSGNFNLATGVAVAPDRDVFDDFFVADTFNFRVRSIDTLGNVVASFGSVDDTVNNDIDGALALPAGLAVGIKGPVVVANTLVLCQT